MFGVKETLCTSCVHREVCSKKALYLDAQKAVDSTFVHTENKSGIYLKDITWIKPVQLQCSYFVADVYSPLRTNINTTDAMGVKAL